MRPPGTTTILLGLACALCAAALAALPGPGAAAGSADADKIISALSLAPKAVTAWDRARKEQEERHAACAHQAASPGPGSRKGTGPGTEPGSGPVTAGACPSPRPEPSLRPGLPAWAAKQ